MRKPKSLGRKPAGSKPGRRRDLVPPPVQTVSCVTSDARPPDPEKERPDIDEAIRRMIEAAYT